MERCYCMFRYIQLTTISRVNLLLQSEFLLILDIILISSFLKLMPRHLNFVYLFLSVKVNI